MRRADTDTKPTQRIMEQAISYVLLIGVVMSTLLVAAGILWHWLKTSHFGLRYSIPRVNLFRFASAEARQALAGAFRPRLLISLGMTTLLLTPYLRVISSLLFFAVKERNWRYSLFTGCVLAVLTYSLWLR
jgi:uncharacterized membrane protein